MLEDIRSNITRLIALYESEKQRADALASRLTESAAEVENCRMQIAELNAQIDNLRLMSAFSGGGDNQLAKERITKLIREIDNCIKLLEK